ncbi:MAG TPA: MATE family efflux transporter [Firmicutes bacterium]|nr:MATE family efflux transporter [Bacillota bacterium]
MSNPSVVSAEASMPASSLRRSILRLAWPAITEQMLHMTVGMADTIMVGRLGPAALAAVGLANQITMTLVGVVSAVSTGTTALVARHIGAQEPDRANHVARQSLVMAFLLAVVVSIIAFSGADFFMDVLFHRTEEVVRHDAAVYIRVLAVAMIANFLLIISNGVLRGAGDTKTPMYITACVNLLNIIGNAVLIFGLGPFPKLGILGAAISTAFAQTVGGVIVIVILFSGKRVIRMSWRDSFRPEQATINRVLRIGVPAAFEHAVMRIGQILYTIIVSSLGTVAYAAHQVALNAESLSFMPGFGFALAATTLVGQALGAEDQELAERSNKEAMKMAMAVMTVLGVVLFVWATPLVRFFVNDEQTIIIGAEVLRIVAFCQPALAMVMVLNGGLRGAGDTVAIMVIAGIGFCVVRTGFAYLLAIQMNMGLVGAWIAMGIDLILRAGMLWGRFKQGRWKYLRV